MNSQLLARILSQFDGASCCIALCVTKVTIKVKKAEKCSSRGVAATFKLLAMFINIFVVVLR